MFTRDDYQHEVERLARDAHEEARDHGRDLDVVIHETVDGHEWVIYTRFNASVLASSNNAEAGAEFGGDLAGILRTRGVSGLLAVLACAAMMQDVREVAADLEDEDEDEDEDAED
jgi:hypothetical protein